MVVIRSAHVLVCDDLSDDGFTRQWLSLAAMLEDRRHEPIRAASEHQRMSAGAFGTVLLRDTHEAGS